MGNSGIFSSCSRPDVPLSIFCPAASQNESICETANRFLLFFQVKCYINRVFYPSTVILILVGTTLNLFSLHCFLRLKKRNSQNVYLFVLSLGDTISLHLNFTLPMLRQFPGIDDRFRASDYLCRVTGVFTESFLIFPTWIVVLLTFERLICMSWPFPSGLSYTQKRAKMSIVGLALCVILLSIYRLFDLKGIDQISVFSVAACDNHHPIAFIRNVNLFIWAILPECLTLIMSLIIIYQIRVATKSFKPNFCKARQGKYSQATKTVLIVSILFFIFHTPTGIITGLSLFYEKDKEKLGIIILVSRKVTTILYQISLSCKFFIYRQTFGSFMKILQSSVTRPLRRTNSAKLGQPVLEDAHLSSKHQTIHFGPQKQSMISRGSPSDSCVKSAEEQHKALNNRHQRTTSTSISKGDREHQPLTVMMTKTEMETRVVLTRTPNLLRKHTRERKRPSQSSKPQVTL